MSAEWELGQNEVVNPGRRGRQMQSSRERDAKGMPPIPSRVASYSRLSQATGAAGVLLLVKSPSLLGD